MTSNYYPTPPQYGAPQYATPPAAYGTPLPVYGAPAFGGHGARRRPGTVIAAAVLAFVHGGLGILFSLYALAFLLLAASSNHSAQVARVLVAIIFAVLLLALSISALFIWGGVAALNGRRGILVVLSAIDVSLSLLGLALSLAGGTTSVGPALVRELPDLIFVVPVLILILQPSSRDFFRARSGKTI